METVWFKIRGPPRDSGPNPRLETTPHFGSSGLEGGEDTRSQRTSASLRWHAHPRVVSSGPPRSPWTTGGDPGRLVRNDRVLRRLFPCDLGVAEPWGTREPPGRGAFGVVRPRPASHCAGVGPAGDLWRLPASRPGPTGRRGRLALRPVADVRASGARTGEGDCEGSAVGQGRRLAPFCSPVCSLSSPLVGPFAGERTPRRRPPASLSSPFLFSLLFLPRPPLFGPRGLVAASGAGFLLVT